MQLAKTHPDQTMDDPFGSNDHLKISIATNSNISWSKTFEFKTTLTSDRKTNSLDDSRQIAIPIRNDSTKLFFLATGLGCSTIQVRQPATTMNNINGSYEVSV